MQSVTATPPAIAPGANVSVTHVVKNVALAAGAAPRRRRRALYLSTDATLDDPGDPVLGRRRGGGAGRRRDGHGDEERADPGRHRPGRYWVIARANATSSVLEADSPAQANNVKATATPVIVGPDVLLTAASTVATATPG